MPKAAARREVNKNGKPSADQKDGWYTVVILLACYLVLFWALGGFGPQPVREKQKKPPL